MNHVAWYENTERLSRCVCILTNPKGQGFMVCQGIKADDFKDKVLKYSLLYNETLVGLIVERSLPLSPSYCSHTYLTFCLALHLMSLHVV